MCFCEVIINNGLKGKRCETSVLAVLWVSIGIHCSVPKRVHISKQINENPLILLTKKFILNRDCIAVLLTASKYAGHMEIV